MSKLTHPWPTSSLGVRPPDLFFSSAPWPPKSCDSHQCAETHQLPSVAFLHDRVNNENLGAFPRLLCSNRACRSWDVGHIAAWLGFGKQVWFGFCIEDGVIIVTREQWVRQMRRMGASREPGVRMYIYLGIVHRYRSVPRLLFPSSSPVLHYRYPSRASKVTR